MVSYKEIFAIILNFNSSKETIELYDQIKNFYQDINIIIVDNNSSLNDKSQLSINIDKSQLIFNSKNLGYAAGNNIAIKVAIANNAEYIWLLNPDIHIAENTLPILLETIESEKNVAAVGPRICYKDQKNKIYSDGGIILKEKGFYTTHLNYNKNIEEIIKGTVIENVDYVNGSVMLLSVPVLKKIGLMLEDFFLYFEETEWCLRASKNKYSLKTNTNAVAFHTSSNKGELYKYYMTRNRILLAKYNKEYYWETVRVVGKLISIDFLNNIRKLTLSQNTLAGIRGFTAGLIGGIKR